MTQSVSYLIAALSQNLLAFVLEAQGSIRLNYSQLVIQHDKLVVKAINNGL
jgi:cyanate permease